MGQNLLQSTLKQNQRLRLPWLWWIQPPQVLGWDDGRWMCLKLPSNRNKHEKMGKRGFLALCCGLTALLFFCRGGRKHKGVDVVCEDGSEVYAPFTGNIDKRARPYGNNNTIDNGVQLSGSGTELKQVSCKVWLQNASIHLQSFKPTRKSRPQPKPHVLESESMWKLTWKSKLC